MKCWRNHSEIYRQNSQPKYYVNYQTSITCIDNLNQNRLIYYMKYKILSRTNIILIFYCSTWNPQRSTCSFFNVVWGNIVASFKNTPRFIHLIASINTTYTNPVFFLRRLVSFCVRFFPSNFLIKLCIGFI